MSRGRSRP